MVPSKFVASLAVLLVLLAMPAEGNYTSPFLSPYLDSICNEVNCGKGSCQAALGYPFNFICKCETGWKRTRLDDDGEANLQFLPCIIPNCTLNYSCMPAAPPVPAFPYNLSAYDPCYWIYCGQGTCTKNQTYTHTCQCNTGDYNLLNISVFPCYSECALGSDCSSLGIKVSNSQSSSQDGNQATSFLLGKFHWITTLLVSLGMALWY